MKTIEQSYLLRARAAKVWQALVDPVQIEQWGGGSDVNMEALEGTPFRLWEGDIYRTNVRVITNKLLVQEWYAEGFREPSEVTFRLADRGDATELTMTQTNVPDDRVADIDAGWKKYYLGPIQELVEAGNQ